MFDDTLAGTTAAHDACKDTCEDMPGWPGKMSRNLVQTRTVNI